MTKRGFFATDYNRYRNFSAGDLFMRFKTGSMMIRNGCEENEGKIIVYSHSDRKEYTSLLNLRL